ncbi:L-arabinose transport system permease protein AraQ [Micromonospora sp. MW-13]|uniref:carbohydrate ABC transporter permease n=1 Tax=unclassified Micromonospora TaxID=2617518 RepID=UPI000E44E688|nr:MULTISPECIES: carbohydrate ABC transporter permease [unclassified Micromonospora]MCX4472954.1 carbohydrate ABC transporter permease [Micromonospora sp. NBC_01655]RGC69137.1 L-arabinose transport system permease protein AraQ [Micromonospora sp. MW-13]
MSHAIIDDGVPELVPAGTARGGPPRPGPWTRFMLRFGKALLRLLVLLVGVFWLVPTFGLAVASLRSSADNSATGWWTVFTTPAQLTLDNYVQVLQNERIVESLWNTVLITVPSTLLVVLLGALGAYALAWMDFPGRDWLFVLVVSLIVVPVQVAIVPDARIFRTIGIYGEISAVVAFHVAFGLPFAIFLLRNFFLNIPRDLLEAARLDGARELVVFARVVLPVGWPAIASLAIFQFLWVWNDLLVALVFATSDNAPITYALREQMRSFSSNLDTIGPGAFLSMLVPLAVFFAFQRYFVQGVLAGSVK